MKYVQPIRDLDKLKLMKEYLLRKSMRDHMLFRVGTETAIPVKMLLGLKVGQVLDHSRVVPATHTLGYYLEGSFLEFPPHYPFYPIGGSLRQAITRHTKSKELDEYMFPSREGGSNKPIGRVHAWTIIHGAAEHVGLKDIGLHSMRKTFGYHYYLRTEDVSTLRKLLKQRTNADTLRYIGVE